MNDATIINQNSPGWLFFVKAAFIAAVAAMSVAIIFMPATIWVKGYMGMGTLLTIASSFMLQKTLRDDFEAKKVVNRISGARAEKMLKDFDVAA